MNAKPEEPSRRAAPEDPAVFNDFSAAGRFLEKWGRRVAVEFRTKLRQDPEPGKRGEAFVQAGKKPFSLRVAVILNFLNYPLFFLGILLALWLVAELILRYTLPEDSWLAVQAYSAPVISVLSPAAVGYWTNWLAIKMLFHPHRPNAVWRGLIHARREELVASLASGIMSSLISPEIVEIYLREEGICRKLTTGLSRTLAEVFQDPEFRVEFKTVLYNLVDRLVNNAETRAAVDQFLVRAIAEWRGRSFGEKMLAWTKEFWGEAVRKEALAFLPEIPKVVEAAFPRIEARLLALPPRIEAGDTVLEPLIAGAIVDGLRSLDLEAVIRGQLGKLDAVALERLLTSNVSAELVFIQTSGGIFGFLVGLAILYQPLRLLLIAVGFLVWGLYLLTVERKDAGGKPGQA